MEIEHLSVESIEPTLSRFNNCFDGLIEKISVDYLPEVKCPNVTISIQTKDLESENEWSLLKLLLVGVDSLAFVEGKTSYRILSDGLIVRQFDGMWGVGFDEEQESGNLDSFTKHAVHFIAAGISWSATQDVA